MIFACLHPVQTNRIGVEDINEGQSANSLKIQFCVGKVHSRCVRCQPGYFIIKPKTLNMNNFVCDCCSSIWPMHDQMIDRQ